ncbi:Chaperone protein DnaK [Nostoc flagelliforme CCNUN1]|uniref:Chaperone protein DnaK n=1 Tax=Nostoc flagelliforme CCNUN1 TaxID=2038116 RepID=A0A2K8SP81_9NOSO|nr:CVNH domain-containing protein [Nostoc flagelliforme]AUB37284.1 Chaperone protein DnaK [Nostoc flagelliforme CCNUN1]
MSYKQHLQHEIDALREHYDLATDKLKRLRHDYAIESNTNVHFQLEKQIEQTEAELRKLAQQLDDLERGLSSGRGLNNRTAVEHPSFSSSIFRVPGILISIAAVIISIGGLTYFITVSRNSQPIKFPEKCDGVNIGISDDKNYTKLQGFCKKLDGTYQQTSIYLKAIENQNGELRENPNMEFSNFHKSCNNIKIEGSILSADCRKIDGTNAHSSIELKGILNDNGHLRYLE